MSGAFLQTVGKHSAMCALKVGETKGTGAGQSKWAAITKKCNQ